ncbi:MAG: PAS domain S-box protein [Cyclobacteriaceae bacterium]|nr:PAS domain S-box protein [Cyclobacteriaceae bacterium]
MEGDLFLKTIIEDPDGMIVFSLDHNYCYTFFSASYSILMQARYGTKIQIGERPPELIKDPGSIQKFRDVFTRIAKGETFTLEEEFINASLSFTFFQVHYCPIKNTQGKIDGCSAYMIDVTPARTAFRKQSEAESNYEMLMTNTRDAVFVMHAEGPDEGKIVSANESAALMHGYDHHEFVGLNIKDIDSPEDRERFDGRMKDLLHGEKLSFEVVHKKKDGSLFSLEVITWLITVNNEKFTMSINRDITEQREIIEAVREREKFIESIANSSPDIIYVFDFIERKNIYSNRLMAAALGFSAEEIAKASNSAFSGLLHPEDLEMLSAKLLRWENATDTDVIETEFRMKNHAGEWRWFLARDTVFKRDKNGKVIQTVGTAQDRTESKKAQIDLKQSEERFQRLQEASFGGIGIHDMGKMIDANQGLANMTGYSIEELMGMDGLLLVASEYREHVTQKIRTGYELPYDVIGLKKDGTRYHLEIQAKNIPFQNRMVRVTEFRDISERKLIEQSIREQNIRLGDIADNLTRKNEQLEEFTQIVSHNLRAPVGNIVTLLSLYDSADSEERDEYLKHLKNSSNLLLGTLNELNEVLKIKQTKKIEKQDLEFKVVFEKVCQMLSARIGELNAEIYSDFTEVPYVQYPNIYLESILLNLLSNALKYHSPNRKPVINIYTHQKEKKVILQMSDNGLGINLDKYGHQIFKMRKTFHKHPESRGLGLFLIKSQIESMGGEISLTSEVDKGTTFYIKLVQ